MVHGFTDPEKAAYHFTCNKFKMQKACKTDSKNLFYSTYQITFQTVTLVSVSQETLSLAQKNFKDQKV